MRNKLNSLALSVAAFVTSAPVALAQNTTVSDIETPTFFFEDVGILINRALNFVMVLGALLVFVYLIWGGIEWITAGGDKGKIEKAKEKITQSIIGLIVLAGMVALFAILQVALGFEIFNFT